MSAKPRQRRLVLNVLNGKLMVTIPGSIVLEAAGQIRLIFGSIPMMERILCVDVITITERMSPPPATTTSVRDSVLFVRPSMGMGDTHFRCEVASRRAPPAPSSRCPAPRASRNALRAARVPTARTRAPQLTRRHRPATARAENASGTRMVATGIPIAIWLETIWKAATPIRVLPSKHL